MISVAISIALAAALAVIVPAPAPIPTITLDPQDNQNWIVSFPPGSSPTNYIWHIQSSTNEAGPFQDEEQWWTGDTFLFRAAQPNYFFRLHGTLRTPNS